MAGTRRTPSTVAVGALWRGHHSPVAAATPIPGVGVRRPVVVAAGQRRAATLATGISTSHRAAGFAAAASSIPYGQDAERIPDDAHMNQSERDAK